MWKGLSACIFPSFSLSLSLALFLSVNFKSLPLICRSPFFSILSLSASLFNSPEQYAWRTKQEHAVSEADPQHFTSLPSLFSVSNQAIREVFPLPSTGPSAVLRCDISFPWAFWNAGSLLRLQALWDVDILIAQEDFLLWYFVLFCLLLCANTQHAEIFETCVQAYAGLVRTWLHTLNICKRQKVTCSACVHLCFVNFMSRTQMWMTH